MIPLVIAGLVMLLAIVRASIIVSPHSQYDIERGRVHRWTANPRKIKELRRGGRVLEGLKL